MNAHRTPSRTRGTIYCILSGALFGLMGYSATRLYSLGFSLDNVLFWRFFIAAIYMGGVQVYLKRRRSRRKVSTWLLLRIVLLASSIYTLNTFFYFTAAKMIGTGVSMVLFFFFPVVIAAYLWLRGKWHLNVHGAAALTAVIAGMMMLKGHGQHALDSIGVLLSLLAGGFYATYILTNRHLTSLIGSSTLTFYTCFGTAVLFGISSLWHHQLAIPSTGVGWYYVLLLGVVSTAFPIQLLLNGLHHISSTKASVLSVFEPIVMIFMGIMFLGEHISLFQSVGIAVMLIGAILIQFEKTTDERAPAKA